MEVAQLAAELFGCTPSCCCNLANALPAAGCRQADVHLRAERCCGLADSFSKEVSLSAEGVVNWQQAFQLQFRGQARSQGQASSWPLGAGRRAAASREALQASRHALRGGLGRRSHEPGLPSASVEGKPHLGGRQTRTHEQRGAAGWPTRSLRTSRQRASCRPGEGLAAGHPARLTSGVPAPQKAGAQ